MRSWQLDGRAYATWHPPLKAPTAIGVYDMAGFIEWLEIGHKVSLALTLGRPPREDVEPVVEPPRPTKRKKPRQTEMVFTSLFEPPKGTPC